MLVSSLPPRLPISGLQEHSLAEVRPSIEPRWVGRRVLWNACGPGERIFKGPSAGRGSMEGWVAERTRRARICGGIPMRKRRRLALAWVGGILAVAIGWGGAFAVPPAEVVNQTWCPATKTCMQWSAAATATRYL